MLRCCRCVAVVVSALFLVTGAHAIELARNGGPRAVIVLARDATAPEAHAAAELQSFIEQVTGARLPIVGKTVDLPMILVGCDAARMVDPAFSIGDLGTDGVRLLSKGRDLIVAGGRPRGTLYAVYTLLEDYVGCRWWAPGACTIPKKPDLSLGSIDLRYVPQFELREPYWHSAFDRDWAVRNKTLSNTARLDDQVGGKPAVAHIHHSLQYLIPAKRYFQEHPEWFSEVDGKRIAERGQLCLSNQEMVKEVTGNVLANLRQRPNTTSVSVAQNDGGMPCKCAKCRAIDEEEGSPSGAILRFVNAVAEEVGKEFPNVVISTFAYTYSEAPPKITKPRSNVLVWLCTMNASYNLPLNGCKRNAGFAEHLAGWSKLTDRLYVWDYVTNFRHYLFIHPNLRVLGPNIRFFAANNVKGVFEQGASETPGAEMMELRAWVLAKLLWNPQLDDNRLINEFLNGYYGHGGKHIRAYIDVIHDINQQVGQPLGCYEEPNRRFMDPVILAQAWKHMQRAAAAVSGDADLTRRVRAAQMPLMYAYMVRWSEMRDKARAQMADWPVGEDPYALLADYKTRAAEIGIVAASEQERFTKLEEKLKLPK